MSDRLSPAQRSCLKDAARGPLRRARHGWAVEGNFRGHQSGTVEALERRGLLRIDRLAACAGEARITGKGKEAAADG